MRKTATTTKKRNKKKKEILTLYAIENFLIYNSTFSNILFKFCSNLSMFTKISNIRKTRYRVTDEAEL